MPLYVYRCDGCGAEQELLRSAETMDDPVLCEEPSCETVRPFSRGHVREQKLMRRVPALVAKQFPGANRW